MDELADPNDRLLSRFAFAASRRVGNAVARNRAKRLLRAAVFSNLTEIEPGWDCLLIARERTPFASYVEIQSAVKQLFSRAGMLADFAGSDRSRGV